MTESQLVNQVMRAVYDEGNMVYRINVGRFKLPSGKWFSSGVPAGFADIMGFRPDGQIFFIECKLSYNKPSERQIEFINKVKSRGALAGVAYSIEDALDIVNGKKD